MKTLCPHPQTNHPMKNLRQLLRAFGAAGSALIFLSSLAPNAGAANASPPTKLTYQGFLTDPSGAPLGNASPTNTSIVFRIFDAGVGGNLKWAEQQTVTIDKGHFSVLLGEGGPGPEPTAFISDLTSVFNAPDASDRFMEITVGNVKITPRIQYLPAPYALLAKSANQIIKSDGTTLLDGSGSGANLTSLNGANIQPGTVVNAAIAANAGIADTKLSTITTPGKISSSAIPNLDASKLTSGALSDNRLSGNVAMRNANNSFSTAQNFDAGGVFINGGFNSSGLLNVNGSTYNDTPISVTARTTDNVLFLFRRRSNATGGSGASSDAMRLVDFVSGGGVGLELMQGYASKPGGGAWGTYSDVRLKHDVRDLEGSLERLMKLRSVTFEYNDVPEAGGLKGTQIGFVAQEVEKVFPDWVGKSGQSGYKTVNITGFESLAVQAIRELRAEKDAQLKAQAERIATLEKRLEQLETPAKARISNASTIRVTNEPGKALPAENVRLADLEQKVSQMAVLEQKLAELERQLNRVAGLRTPDSPAAPAPASEVKAEVIR